MHERIAYYKNSLQINAKRTNLQIKILLKMYNVRAYVSFTYSQAKLIEIKY